MTPLWTFSLSLATVLPYSLGGAGLSTGSKLVPCVVDPSPLHLDALLHVRHPLSVLARSLPLSILA